LLARKMDGRADIFFFFDADLLVRRKTMEILHRTLRQNHKIDVAAAELVPAAKFVHPSKRRGFAVQHVASYKAKLGGKVKTRISGGGYAIRRKVIQNIRLPEDLQGGVDIWLTLKVGRGRIERVPRAQIVFRQPIALNDIRKQRLRQLVGREQMKQHFPKEDLRLEGVPHKPKPFKEKVASFARLPLSQKLMDLSRRAAYTVAGLQFRLVRGRVARGQKVDVWKKTRSDKIPRRRR